MSEENTTMLLKNTVNDVAKTFNAYLQKTYTNNFYP